MVKKYSVAEGVSGRWIGKLNKKQNERLDKESLSDNDIMQLFEAIGRYIAKNCGTEVGKETVIKSLGKEIISFKFF